MGKSLQDLGLKAEVIGTDTDFENLPEQMGTYAPPPQPGTYVFQLPASLQNVWDTVTTKDKKDRIKAVFDADAPLVIVQSVNNEYNGQPFRTSISNAERNRSRKGEPEVLVSDMDYVLVALGEKKKPKTNIDYIKAFTPYAAKPFKADVTWSWGCNDTKNKFIDDGQGGLVETQEPGCGKKYYQRDVPKDEHGKVPLRITCECGANLRGFPNLGNFKPA